MCNEIGCPTPHNETEIVDAIQLHGGNFIGILNSDAAWRYVAHGWFCRTFGVSRHPVGDACFKYLVQTGDYIEAAQMLAVTPGVLTPAQVERVKELTYELVARGERHESDFNLFKERD